jgi:diaminopimelate decarboxylase
MISKISKDDILCFKNAGAYGYNMSSNYNSRLRPAELCIHDDKIKKIREEENLEDLLNNQIDIF